MNRLLLISALSIPWGIGYGYLVVGRWRLDLVLGTGFLGGIVWRVLLQTAGILGPIAVFAAAGFYPLRAIELVVGFVLTFFSAAVAERTYRRLAGHSARATGLIGEEDL